MVNAAVQGDGQAIEVTAAQLAQAMFKSGSDADLLWERAHHGIDWGAWKSFKRCARHQFSLSDASTPSMRAWPPYA